MVKGLLIYILAFFLAGTALAAEKVRFGIHFKFNPHYFLPALAAIEKGFWKAQGLEVEYLTFDAPVVMGKALAGGDVDLGVYGLTDAILLASAGAGAVILHVPIPDTEFYFWVRANSGFKEPKDVKDAKIGISGLGLIPHIMARAVLKGLGIDEKDVKFIAVAGAPQIAAVRAGTIDIATLSNFTMAPLKAMGEVREVLRMNDYLPKGVADQGLMVRKELLEKNPALVRKVVKGFLQGAEFTMKNPEWAMEKMKEELKYRPEVARMAIPWLKYDLTAKLDEVKIKNTAEFLIEYGMVDRKKLLPLDKMYAKGFVE